jgi:hypothetical protein
LNPIEMSFSKLKAHLRKAAERPAKLLIISGTQVMREIERNPL